MIVFNRSGGYDRIVGLGTNDRIQIDSGASHFDQLRISEVGNNVRIAFADTVIKVVDVEIHTLQEDDFLF